jgi:hypothetical protein
MALVTSPTGSIPDLNYEYHTITVDTIGQESANTFTCFLSQPLKNIVQARLLYCSNQYHGEHRTLLCFHEGVRLHLF